MQKYRRCKRPKEQNRVTTIEKKEIVAWDSKKTRFFNKSRKIRDLILFIEKELSDVEEEKKALGVKGEVTENGNS